MTTTLDFPECDYCFDDIPDAPHWLGDDEDRGEFCSDECASNAQADRADSLLDKYREDPTIFDHLN